MKTSNTYLSLNDMSNTGNKWAIIAINETYHWSEKILKRGVNKIEGIYLVDLKKPTHLCSLEVSFPATFIRNFFDNRDQFNDDEITYLEKDNGGEEFKYLNGGSSYKLIKYYRNGKEEDILENEMCNPSYC